jgi:orotidine-5'-phosphate decarboxylase
VYEHVADLAHEWNEQGNVGLVVGATVPAELSDLRERVPTLPFLVPGIGAQGGDAEAAVEFGLAEGIGLINSSRGIIFAGENSTRWEHAAGEAAKRLKRRLNQFR